MPAISPKAGLLQADGFRRVNLKAGWQTGSGNPVSFPPRDRVHLPAAGVLARPAWPSVLPLPLLRRQRQCFARRPCGVSDCPEAPVFGGPGLISRYSFPLSCPAKRPSGLAAQPRNSTLATPQPIWQKARGFANGHGFARPVIPEASSNPGKILPDAAVAQR